MYYLHEYMRDYMKLNCVTYDLNDSCVHTTCIYVNEYHMWRILHMLNIVAKDYVDNLWNTYENHFGEL